MREKPIACGRADCRQCEGCGGIIAELVDRPTDAEFERVCTANHALEREIAQQRHVIAAVIALREACRCEIGGFMWGAASEIAADKLFALLDAKGGE